MAAEVWDAAYSEGRHLLRVVATRARMHGSADVASHHSAAVLHGLPLFRLEPERVHLSGPASNGRVRAGDPMVARHRLTVPAEDRVIVDGVACTSLARTVADVIRSSTPETSIAVLDASFRGVAWKEASHTYDPDVAERFRTEIGRRLPAGGRGVVQARELLAIADGRAQLPGESVSRLYLIQLGFAPPRLQVPVRGPNGRDFYVDFGLDDVEAWGEFDGRGKYVDPAMLGGRDVEDAVLAEKAREDWIRGTTRRPMVRWGFGDIATAQTLARRLDAFGLRPSSTRSSGASPHPNRESTLGSRGWSVDSRDECGLGGEGG